MLITDQVATAPCTDSIQVRFRTFEAKASDSENVLPSPQKENKYRHANSGGQDADR